MPVDARPHAGPGQAFKRVLDLCMEQAGLSNRMLHDRLLQQTGQDVHPNTIDSWRRPHSATGVPTVPRDFPVVVVQWLCSQEHVTVTEEELLAAWRSDKAAQLAHRSDRHGPGDDHGGAGKSARLERGEWSEGIIDGTIHLGMDTMLGKVDHRLLNLLNSGRPIPTYYAYLTHRGYLNWVNLTEDHRYSYYRSSVELYQANAAEIAQTVVEATGGGDVDLVSLGPGTGTKDRALVVSLRAACGANGPVYYYPYDINPAMVVHAIQSVLAGGLSRDDIAIKAIIAHFDLLAQFSRVYRYREGPNVLSLLGNTLGNMGEDFGFLETVFQSGMLPGDVLLLEVRCHVDEEAGQAPGIGEEAKRRFNFGPLEILGADYEEHRDVITIRRERARSVIPNTVTTVTHCERVRCGPMTWNDVRLAYVHEYSEPDLDAAIERIGYRIVRKFHRGVASDSAERVVLLYILRRP